MPIINVFGQTVMELLIDLYITVSQEWRDTGPITPISNITLLCVIVNTRNKFLNKYLNCNSSYRLHRQAFLKIIQRMFSAAIANLYPKYQYILQYIHDTIRSTQQERIRYFSERTRSLSLKLVRGTIFNNDHKSQLLTNFD